MSKPELTFFLQVKALPKLNHGCPGCKCLAHG